MEFQEFRGARKGIVRITWQVIELRELALQCSAEYRQTVNTGQGTLRARLLYVPVMARLCPLTLSSSVSQKRR